MDVGGQARSAVPIANAQIHLDADSAGGLNRLVAQSNETKTLALNYFAKSSHNVTPNALKLSHPQP